MHVIFNFLFIYLCSCVIAMAIQFCRSPTHRVLGLPAQRAPFRRQRRLPSRRRVPSRSSPQLLGNTAPWRHTCGTCDPTPQFQVSPGTARQGFHIRKGGGGRERNGNTLRNEPVFSVQTTTACSIMSPLYAPLPITMGQGRGSS